MSGHRDRIFVGFGFGPIQSGLFLYEAFRSGNFTRLIVAEILPDIVHAVRNNQGGYQLNVATANGIEHHEVQGIEIYNPTDPADREALIQALAEADEIATALPSIDFYEKGTPSCVDCLVAGMEQRALAHSAKPCVLYAAENHNHAAEVLRKAVHDRLCAKELAMPPMAFLNTVIGKMSGVVTNAAHIEQDELRPAFPDSTRAFLIEAFNRILISRLPGPEFSRGITVFEEKDELLPFEEAKLYGHNATHALLGFLANRKGYRLMSEISRDPELLDYGRTAFLEESRPAMLHRHAGIDPMFTPEGYQAYADDLLDRMMNPYLQDQVDRVIRDPERKLLWDDRLIGTMRLAIEAGVAPRHYARGAAAALLKLMEEKGAGDMEPFFKNIWKGSDSRESIRRKVKQLLLESLGHMP